MKKENVMACTILESTGERLINRGLRLTQLFQSKLTVLYLSKEGEPEGQDKQEMIRLAEESGARFVHQTYRDDAHKVTIILEKAQEYNVTQLLIGQYSQSRWDVFKKGNFINRLLKNCGEIDLHIISLENNY